MHHSQGPEAVRAYLRECKRLGFDYVELSTGGRGAELLPAPHLLFGAAPHLRRVVDAPLV